MGVVLGEPLPVPNTLDPYLLLDLTYHTLSCSILLSTILPAPAASVRDTQAEFSGCTM